MKKEKIVFELNHGIALTMPRYPMSDEVLSAFILLGGLLYHGFIETKQDMAKFRNMVDDCFDYIKKGDFSKIANEVKRVVTFDEEVEDA